MAIYGGFAPGTYNGWSLNLLADIFVTPGISRGLQVTAPGGMQVNVGVDATNGDGVCWLPNGCFVRIDAATAFAVPGNGSGSTRTDAVVAFCDPTGASNPSFSLSYQTNWSSGFAPGTTNQLVIALVSVANGAVTISPGNITQNTAAASITGIGGSNSMVASDGVGLTVQDNSSTNLLAVVLTGLSTNQGRNIGIQTTDVSSIGHSYQFTQDNGLVLPQNTTARGYIGNAARIIMNQTAVSQETAGTYLFYMSLVNNSTFDLHIQAGNGTLAFDMLNGTTRIDTKGNFTGGAYGINVGGVAGTPARFFAQGAQPANATNGDVWISA